MSEQKSAKSPLWLKRLGSRIRQVRRIRGLTQTDIAKPNLTKSFISLLESGRTYPSVGTLVALASRLQTSLALLLLETSQLPREAVLDLLTLARAATESRTGQPDRLLAAAEVLAAEADDLKVELMLTRGDIAILQGRDRDAERAFNDALAHSRRQHVRAYEPRALARLAQLTLKRGDENGAKQRLEEALVQFRATRTLRSAEGCDALLSFAQMLSRHGRKARALRTLEEVAQVAQRHGLPLTLGRAQVAAAQLHHDAGRTQQANTALHAAKEALAEADASAELAEGLRTLGRLMLETGSAHEAQDVLERALQVQEPFGDERSRAATLDDLARVLLRLGRTGDAQRHAKTAFDLAQTHKDLPLQGRSLMTQAQIARAQHRWKQAVDQFKDAVEIFKRARQQRELTEAARELGMLLKERGEHAAAADYLAMALTTEKK